MASARTPVVTYTRMEQLNRNVSGLNTIYEIQLKSISSQIESIEHIKQWLEPHSRKCMTAPLSTVPCSATKTEKMTRQLAELNQVYSRLLQAMTVNMGYQQPAQPAQPVYQQQPQPAQQQNYQQAMYSYVRLSIDRCTATYV